MMIPGADAVESVQRCLARLDADRSNAVVARRDDAVLAEAKALELRRRRGKPVGPLTGLCFTVKATIRSGVLPATAGSLLLDETLGRPAPVVERLRRAGALLMGVTNCGEFALVPLPTNRRYGATTNPVAPGLTPGGSSAGCAAAVAGGLVPLSVGTDYGGSVRFPASCTGILGFRPARGSVPASGQVPAAPVGSPRARFSIPGLLAADADVFYRALAVFLARPVTARRPRRVAWVGSDGSVSVDPVVAHAVEEVAVRLDAVRIAQGEINPLCGAAEVFDRIRASDDLEPIRTLSAGRSDQLTDRMRAILADRARPAGLEAEAAAERLRASARRFLRDYPLLVAPVATEPTPLAGTDTGFEILAPCRAVSLLGVASLAVPAGVAGAGAPVGVQLVGSVPALIWAAQTLGSP